MLRVIIMAQIMTRVESDLPTLKNQALQDALNMIVVNAELTHAHDAPEDFNDDAMQSGAYEIGNGITIAPMPNPDDLK